MRAQNWRRGRGFAVLLALTLVTNWLAACTLNATAPPTVTAALPPTVTPAPVTAQPDYPDCGWQWARQDASPEWADRLQSNLASSGIDVAAIRVELYGENCLDSTGAVRYFAAMTTDFYLTLPMASGSRAEDMASAVARVHEAIQMLDVRSLPAPPGYLDMVFVRDGQESRLRVLLADLQAALARGLTGSAFFEALGGLR